MDTYAQERRAAAISQVHVISDKNYDNLTAKSASKRRLRDQELKQIAQDPAALRAYLLKASMLEDRI